MDHLSEIIQKSVYPFTVSAVMAFVLSVAAQLLPGLLRFFRSAESAKEVIKEESKGHESEFDSRLFDVRHALFRQEAAATWSKWSMNFLVFGQYIVGGVLATSFIQETLSKESVGFLGVLVLVSALIHQRFRPDLQYRSAKERAAQLRVLIRKAEDDLFPLRSSDYDPKRIQAVRQMISDGLSKIEASELSDTRARIVDDAA